MKTQNINLAETLDFVFAGHTADFRSERAETLEFKDGKLFITEGPSLTRTVRRRRMVHSRDFEWLKDEKFQVGDDRSIQGYY